MFIAREEELDILKKTVMQQKSSLVVVYGRRRIGKTETIRHFINTNQLLKLEVTGVFQATKQTQIKSFARAVEKLGGVNFKIEKYPKDWSDIFFLLEDCINFLNLNEKKVLFLDEFPWLDTQKSGFFEAFSYFWNNFCTARDDIIVVVCGSAASYMINKIVKNRKTLHNRIDIKIAMEQFLLYDAKKMLEAKGCQYSSKSIVDIYIAVGGVAKYLDYIDCKEQPNKNIDTLCFNRNGLLYDEYEDLYESLFDKAQTHRKIMDLLSLKWSGYIQKEISQKLSLTPSTIFKPLEELELSGFITSVTKFGQKSREKIYRTTDCFSYFYNKWMKSREKLDWNLIQSSTKYNSWSGFAFENICHMHQVQIKKILGISGVTTSTHYWAYIPESKDEYGAQIDMLLYHTNGSNNIEIIECKYHNDMFTIDKSYYENLKRKISIFKEQTNFRHNIRVIFITTFGVAKNEYYNELVSQDITIEQIMSIF